MRETRRMMRERERGVGNAGRAAPRFLDGGPMEWLNRKAITRPAAALFSRAEARRASCAISNLLQNLLPNGDGFTFFRYSLDFSRATSVYVIYVFEK